MFTLFRLLAISGAWAARRVSMPSGALYSRRKQWLFFFMVIMARGFARCFSLLQDGGHTPANRLTETCSVNFLCTSLKLDVHGMVN